MSTRIGAPIVVDTVPGGRAARAPSWAPYNTQALCMPCGEGRAVVDATASRAYAACRTYDKE